MRITKLSLLAVLAILLFSCNQKQQSPPNIILIMTDDVALEHWGCYGGNIPTPNIDKLAATGMKFTRAFSSSSLCTPSRYSIMTGQFAGRCRHERFLSENPSDQPYRIAMNTPISENNITLHKVLNTAGYYTGFVGKFHIGNLEFDRPEQNSQMPIIAADISFDSREADSLLSVYQNIIANKAKELTDADFVAGVQWENPEQLPHTSLHKHHLEWMTEGAMRFFDSAPADKPFFLHFNSTALHGPNHYENLQADAHYSPSGRMREPYKYHPSRKTVFERLDSLNIDHGSGVADYLNHYMSGIIYMDDQVGAIIRKLEETGRMENTLVILSADHNTEPGKSTIYNKGVHIPFIASWPAVIKQGSTTSEAVQFIDFLPTFSALAGAQIPEGNKIDGISFANVLKGEPLKEREFMFFEQGHSRGISDGKFKYIAMRFPTSVTEKIKNRELEIITHFGKGLHAHSSIAQEYHPGYFDADQLYDLTTDPYEQNNLINNPEYATQLQEMKEALQEFLSSFMHPFDLSDTAFVSLPEYKQAVEATKSQGTDFIPWWNRKLDYPPK